MTAIIMIVELVTNIGKEEYGLLHLEQLVSTRQYNYVLKYHDLTEYQWPALMMKVEHEAIICLN